MRDLSLVLASNYLSKYKCVHVRQCSTIVYEFTAMESFADLVQSTILQLGAIFFSQFVT